MTQDEKLILAHKFYDALKEGKLSVIIGSDNYGNESILVKLKNQKVKKHKIDCEIWFTKLNYFITNVSSIIEYCDIEYGDDEQYNNFYEINYILGDYMKIISKIENETITTWYGRTKEKTSLTYDCELINCELTDLIDAVKLAFEYDKFIKDRNKKETDKKILEEMYAFKLRLSHKIIN